LLRELDRAPEDAQKVLASIPPEYVELVEYNDEIGSLRDASLPSDYALGFILTPASQYIKLISAHRTVVALASRTTVVINFTS